jgi:hypothetical protein
MRIFKIFASLMAVGFAAEAVAQEGAATRKFHYSATPEGKTLPDSVYRFRAIYQSATGDQAYDKDGNKADAVVKATVVGGAAVAEYGYTDKLSLQLKVPFYLSQKVELNQGTSAYSSLKSSTFAANASGAKNAAELTAAIRAQVVAKFKAGGACASDAACGAAYDAGLLKTPTAGSIIPGTSSVAAGIAYKDAVPVAAAQIDAAIDAGIKAAAESTGGRGMGDMEIGVLYEAFSAEPVFFSLGGGLRLPTGNRNLAGTEQDTTRSAYELGLRMNLDYLPAEWFMVSWQNQSELGLTGTKREVNGVSQERKRDGVRQVGFIYLKPSLAAVSPALDSIRTTVGVSYDYDSSEKITSNGKETATDRGMVQNMFVGVGYSLFGLGVPAQIDIDYEKPMKGTNQAVAVTKTTMTLKAFAKF